MERWENCPGSVAPIPELLAEALAEDDPEYRRAGTAAHAAVAKCLEENLDAWEVTGEVFEGYEISPDIADAVQVYLDECRRFMGGTWGVEEAVERPEIDPDFYGTTDFWALTGGVDGPLTLVIRDYKNGAGVVVEIENNPQVRYYALGVLLGLADKGIEPELVDMGIVQPNVSWHPDGVIRRKVIRASELTEWADFVLKPAMQRARESAELKPGSWCRFCPRKIICPALIGMFKAAATTSIDQIALLDDQALGLEWLQIEAVNSYIKAIKTETMRRLMRGADMPAVKLVHGKADRVWKDDARAVFTEKFGDLVLTDPKFKSPAEMERVSAEAKALVKQYAYSPEGSLTVAPADDKRGAVKVTSEITTIVQAMLDKGQI
jgi:hypothetical protein